MGAALAAFAVGAGAAGGEAPPSPPPPPPPFDEEALAREYYQPDIDMYISELARIQLRPFQRMGIYPEYLDALYAAQFETESGFDKLTIANRSYSGDERVEIPMAEM